jgi:hypothetical protein
MIGEFISVQETKDFALALWGMDDEELTMP